ncbi:unnamed protein product [Parascedosporium putredinis]|uniref:Phenol 2-monooxygenase n=1 Tax=Parascedosporium putredinis TaxID=1442378 RepID=A0A9P1H5V4_9PEZI|nr:unnamed protein product [Parascedosporium putredinis]CAI7998099.1 unnamed protein product [Parascedosporium putredinis]
MAPGALHSDTDMGEQQNGDNRQDAALDTTMDALARFRSLPLPPSECQVCIVGAGPAGLMLATNLSRFGIKATVIDDRADQTPVGRADGLQPKTIETFRQMRLADLLLQRGVRVYDISFWRSTPKNPSTDSAAKCITPIIDVLDPYILLVHQGMVESLFIEDMRKRGVEVRRNTAFESYNVPEDKSRPLQVNCRTNVTQDRRTIHTQYLIGCDGAHSKVRKSIPDARPVGMSQAAIWGVLDGELVTDFPDIWSKTLVNSKEHGSILIIMAPYEIDWKYLEWFGRYQIGQRVASRFCDNHLRAFLAGDASHTHSPKSAQGMNTSMHDSWNLAWKLNFSVRGLAKPCLMESYEQERRKIALDLVNFDYEHAYQIAGGDAVAIAESFKTNVRFMSGIGAEYSENPINQPINQLWAMGDAKPGCLLPPAKVTRYIDSNPVDIQLDIPMLGQFRIYLLMWDVQQAGPFLETFCQAIASRNSFISQLSAAASISYATQPRLPAPEDIYQRPERYTVVSHLFTFALIKISDLPALLQDSRWTFYLDDIPEQDTQGKLCTNKWLGSLGPGEVAIVNVRPDGYVGSVGRWDTSMDDSGEEAAKWLDAYYEGFCSSRRKGLESGSFLCEAFVAGLPMRCSKYPSLVSGRARSLATC